MSPESFSKIKALSTNTGSSFSLNMYALPLNRLFVYLADK